MKAVATADRIVKCLWYIWIGFVVCLAVVLAAMGWTSLAVLRLERQAALEENVRLALWRIDSTLAPLVAQESVRPYFAYRSFLPVDRAYASMFGDRGKGETLIPSPLLEAEPPYVLVHFQFEPDGQLTSPQAPTGSNYALAVPQHVSSEAIKNTGVQLARVAALTDRGRLRDLLPEHRPEPVSVVFTPRQSLPGPPHGPQRSSVAPAPAAQQQAIAQQQAFTQQEEQSRADYQKRSQAVMNSANVLAQNVDWNARQNPWLPATDVSGVPMTPLWIGGDLLLARRITAGGQEYIQGCLLDWPAIKRALLESIEDVLPKADLQAVMPMPIPEKPRMLAALPVQLVPGPYSAAVDQGISPIGLSLAIAWACVLLAALAVAGLVAGVIRLSERRASFVTAVTHELRTPLTTFQMYTEMLAEGMIIDQQQQKLYLGTLRAEAVRLTHLVENVLSYARLERGRGNDRLECVTLDRLVEPMRCRLAERADQAGMELVVEVDERASEVKVLVNVSAVEQILFNLVDNACKYAAAAVDRRIHLCLQSNGKSPQVRVRDHGPGVSVRGRRQLFSPFSKSAHEAARTAPGVGLGLALSRRLARDMGGGLRLDDGAGEGASFVLTLGAAPGE